MTAETTPGTRRAAAAVVSVPASPGQDLAAAVLAVPGIAALEPGITTTLHTVDARIRRADSAARYGLQFDPVAGTLVVEVAVRSLLPVRSVVENLQEAAAEALRRAGHDGIRVVVRVQSVA